MKNIDILQTFLFENTQIRGQLVKISTSYQEVLSRHSYPEPVELLLGETLCAATLLSNAIKQGSVIMQVEGDGPLSLLLAHCDHERKIRGLAKWDDEIQGLDLQANMGTAHLGITVDPGVGKERYQGVVTVKHAKLSQAIEEYFTQSEQIATRAWFTANGTHAAGLLLQRLPSSESKDDQYWQHITTLASTITSEELLGLDNKTLLHRLFHEEDVRLFEEQDVTFYCSCSAERMEQALKMLDKEELVDLANRKEVDVTCEFCNKTYTLGQTELTRIVAEIDSSAGSSSIH